MSLQARLNTVIAGLLLLCLAALIALLLAQSTPRIVAETQGMMRFAEVFARRSLNNIADSPVGRAELESLLAQLFALRHVTIRLEQEGEPRKSGFSYDGIKGWFIARIRPEIPAEPVRLPVATRTGSVGTLVIEANPGDEIAELLDEILQISAAGALVSLILFAVTTSIVNRSLRPIGAMRRALSDLEEGRLEVSINPDGPPELTRLAHGINSLAGALVTARSENARLSGLLVRLQDDERRDIARELHDEFGPHLFAARTRLALLKSALTRPRPDVAAALTAADRLAHEINDIQATNRRVLHKLEPAGLKELVLAAPHEDMADRLRLEQPHIDLNVRLPEQLPAIDTTYELTVYRVVQEGLTNAYRHAAASHIEVEVRLCNPTDAPGTTDTTIDSYGRAIEIEVTDDGVGLMEHHANGFGLSAMRQRILALGGTCTVANIPGGGVSLAVVLKRISGETIATHPVGMRQAAGFQK